MARSKPSNEVGVRRLIVHIGEATSRTIDSGQLVDIDRSVVEGLSGDLSTYADPMIRILTSLSDADTSEFALECLWRLLGAAFVLGSRVEVSATAEALLTKVAARNQAATARLARHQKTELAHAELIAAILAEAGDTELVGSRKYAESLRDGVIRRTGGGSQGKSAASIQRIICHELAKRSQT